MTMSLRAFMVLCMVVSLTGSSLARHQHPHRRHVPPRHASQRHRPPASVRIQLAKHEPASGCYLGAYVASDNDLDPVIARHNGNLSREEALGEVLRKHLATAFIYWRYGDPFPSSWAKSLLGAGIAPHLALEPAHGLSQVEDDDYLVQFAREAASCNGPVFLRFACEMNGEWTPWHGDPALYRLKFKLVHDVMARLAPNVAMIWCVNQNPEHSIQEYYPGDAAVDWVGINFYSVLHHNNNIHRPGILENPAGMLRYVYQTFAARKPIAICEYGASHREALAPEQDRSDVAITKLRQLLLALPRDYPRVKLVDFFDCNNMEHAPPGRRLNDYSVTNSPSVLQALQQLVASPYYLAYPVSAARGGEFFPSHGEIRVDGIIQKIDLQRRSVLLLASRVVLPDGEDIKLRPARNKMVYLASGAQIHGTDAPGESLLLLDLRVGDEAFGLGRDLGVGKPLPARMLMSDRIPLQTMWMGKVGAPPPDLTPRASVVWNNRPDG